MVHVSVLPVSVQVKADRGNKKLQTLQQVSRHVNDMAAVVVTSTKAGQMQIEEKRELNYSFKAVVTMHLEIFSPAFSCYV